MHISLLLVFHCTSLTKHKFKDKIIRNFKMATMKHKIILKPFWSEVPVWLFRLEPMKLALWGPHTNSCWSQSGQWFRGPGCWGEERDFDSVSCWEERLETLGMVSYLQRILPPLQPNSSSPTCTRITNWLRYLIQCTIAHLSSVCRGQWGARAAGHEPQLVPIGIVLNPMLTSPKKKDN